YGLCVQTQGARLQAVARILEAVLEQGSAAVRARALRGLGHLRFASKKAQAYARECLPDPSRAATGLRYFELCPEKSPIELPNVAGLEQAALRCLAAQPSIAESDSAIDTLITRCLALDAPEP